MFPPPPADLLARYDGFLFDLDGVLYRGAEPIDGASEAVGAVRGAGRPVVFVTNNATRTPDEVAAFLRELGFEASSKEVVTSATATAALLSARAGARAFVIGERGLREALTSAGIELVDGDPERADLVVVGLDRELTYAKLKRAALLVQRGAALVASNPDRTFPQTDGLWPGAGSLLAAVEAATGATATIVGKPHPPLFESARDRAGSRKPLVVGDRLDTDIAGANRLGWDSLLVLTGVSTQADLESASEKPTYVAPDLRFLSELRGSPAGAG
ncbi:MAG: TIGR01459 family HAD-type hydrolase, partial [Actinomycetota bacterium]